MPNQYFQFKQFTVYQDKCAMKVTTDGCMFGAVAATYCKLKILENKVLDIGTGTGLLALMYAQQNAAALIDAVEIDSLAAGQALENFELSEWKERLHVNNTSILNLALDCTYDLIITNPPFYENQLASGNVIKNKAHHSTDLSLQALMQSIKTLIKPSGSCILLMPFYREEETIKIALVYNLEPARILNIRQSPTHNFFRSIILFKQKPDEMIREEITIKGSDGNYSNQFKKLLAPYYLHL